MFPEYRGETITVAPSDMSNTEAAAPNGTGTIDEASSLKKNQTLGERLARHRTPSHQRVRTPWWRRLTALVSLGSLVVIAGITLAAVAGISALLLLMFLEGAAG